MVLHGTENNSAVYYHKTRTACTPTGQLIAHSHAPTRQGQWWGKNLSHTNACYNSAPQNEMCNEIWKSWPPQKPFFAVLVHFYLYLCLHYTCLFPTESFSSYSQEPISPWRSTKRDSLKKLLQSLLNFFATRRSLAKCQYQRLRLFLRQYYYCYWDCSHSKTVCQFTDEKQQSQWHLTRFSATLTIAVWTDFNGSLLDHRLAKGHYTHLI